MKTISINFHDDDLTRLDNYAARWRLKRNAAVLKALDVAEQAERGPTLTTGTGMTYAVPGWGEVPSGDGVQLRTAEERAAALELLKPAMESLPDVRGIHESNNPPTPGKADDGWKEPP